MIGLDTNILLRLIVQDDPVQAAMARQFVEKHCTKDEPGYINHAVLVETAWVLKSTYRYSHARIRNAIGTLLDMDIFHIAQPRLIEEALQSSHKAGCELPDAMIGLLNAAESADYTITFDRAAAKLPEFKLLKA